MDRPLFSRKVAMLLDWIVQNSTDLQVYGSTTLT